MGSFRTTCLGAATILSGLALGVSSTGVRADADAIRIGMTGPLSGPSEQLGRGVRAGIEAYFGLVNERGGVHGKKLALVALDDAYEPGKTGPNMRKLIDEERVFAVLGNPGTPTAAVAVPIAIEKHVPLFGAFTGAALLRKTPPDRYVVNFRASYGQETAEIVRGLIDELGIAPEEIAFFTQNDAYGDAGHKGAVAALKARGFAAADRLPHGRYPRNTVDVEAGLSRILDPAVHPRAVVMVGAYKPCAKFIKLAKQHGLKALFVNVSFVLGDQLRRELGNHAEDVVVTQVVPAYDSDLPVVREYRERVKGDDVGFVSLEGFIAAKAFVAALAQAGPGASAEGVIDALERGAPIDLGLEAPARLSKERHQLSDRVWPTVIHRGRFASLASWTELKSAVSSK
ncbi:MAG: ABC transporter substrate-binding protein [Polyangiales bacterium]